MASKPDPQIGAKLLSSLFSRFTADRDALFAAVERCEQRMVDLSQRLASTASSEEPAAIEKKADEALALATEALVVAREALSTALHGRE